MRYKLKWKNKIFTKFTVGLLAGASYTVQRGLWRQHIALFCLLSPLHLQFLLVPTSSAILYVCFGTTPGIKKIDVNTVETDRSSLILVDNFGEDMVRRKINAEILKSRASDSFANPELLHHLPCWEFVYTVILIIN